MLELAAKRHKSEPRRTLGEALLRVRLELSEGFERRLTEKEEQADQREDTKGLS